MKPIPSTSSVRIIICLLNLILVRKNFFRKKPELSRGCVSRSMHPGVIGFVMATSDARIISIIRCHEMALRIFEYV